MKNTLIKFSILTVFNCCFYACYDVTISHRLSILNMSDKKISVLYSNRANGRLTENNIAYFTSEENVIQPDSSFDITILGTKDPWHKYIDAGKTEKLFLYIFDIDSLKKFNNSYSMDDLINQKKYLKILSYSEKQLNEINWKIRYQ
jgi:hypothetical protein